MEPSSTSVVSKDDVEASLYFLPRDEIFQTEKPYTCRFDPDGLYPATNIEPVSHNVFIQNMRPHVNRFSLEKEGFQIFTLESPMQYQDYADNSKIEKIHIPKVTGVLSELFKTPHIFFLEFEVRRRDEGFPKATGENYQFTQPGSRVHLDFSCSGVRDTLWKRWPNAAEQALQLQWQCINVWHPLRGPLVDWPLALCDASSVDFSQDTMPGDVVDRTEFFENTQVHHNPAQKWYWLRDQMPSELMIFKNADSRFEDGNASLGVPHVAFDNPNRAPDDFLRESIEMRFLVFWEEPE